MKTLIAITVVWAILLAVLFIVQAPLSEALWMLYLPIHWAFPVCGAALALACIWTAFRKRLWRTLVPTTVCALGLDPVLHVRVPIRTPDPLRDPPGSLRGTPGGCDTHRRRAARQRRGR